MTSRWFGDYEIIRQLRAGGMATLYLARRHGAAGFSRLVALKMIRPNLVAQPGFVEMFVDEARICSQISHPNVVHVEEFGVIDGTHYLVMEYVDGCSLSELLQVLDRESRTLDPELAAAIIAQVAGGLHAAHETRDQDGQPLDIIHRDISPSNIVLSATGNAKLIDFGIARARNRLTETQELSLKGKFKYVAPEQATGALLDRRCDVFSLGVVFWELLVGQPLFTEDSALALVRRMHRTEVPPPSSIERDVPPAFDPIVLAMLQHDRARRPQTAAEVQRWIVQAAPGAANRDPCELGALALDVRDQRAAWYAARRAAGEAVEAIDAVDAVDANRHVSFSPVPHSHRTASSGGERGDNARRSSAEVVPGTARRWLPRDPRAAILGLAILLVLGVIGGVLLGQRTPSPGLPSAVASEPARHAAEEVARPPVAPSPAPPRAARDVIGDPAIAVASPVHVPPEPAPPEPAPPGRAPPEAAPPSSLPPQIRRPPARPSIAVKSAPVRGPVPPRALAGNPDGRTERPARSATPGKTGQGPAIIRGFDPDGEGAKPGDSGPVNSKPPIVTGFDDGTSDGAP